MSGTLERDRKQYFKVYKEKNKEKRNAQSAKRREEKRDEINEGHKKYYYENFERITKYIDCCCGKKYQLCKKARHFKSQHHISYSN